MTHFKTDPSVFATLGLMVILALAAIACGEAPPQDASKTAETNPHETTTEAHDEVPAASRVGSVSFAVDGNDRHFEHLPQAECFFTMVASSIRAYPDPDTTETLAIHFTSMNLKKLTFPADLPLPRDTSKPMDPMTYGAAVGFGYTDAEGEEWAGTGRAHVDGFSNDGVIHGTFDQVTLPCLDRERPDITITGGTFSARISRPW